MKKFKDLEYKRVDFVEAVNVVRKLEADIKSAKSGSQLKQLYEDYQKQYEIYDTAITIASIRNSIDMNDKFYEDEMNYYYEEIPKFEQKEKKAVKALLDSPYFNELKEEFGDIFVKNKENEQRLSSEETVEDSIEEGKLTQEYSKVAATCTIEFMGEECNFYGLLKHMESTDRQERKDAFEAWAKLYESISEKLDDIYSKLVTIRNRKSKKLGFESYIDMAYANRQRYDYDKNDVAKFRQQVKEIIVPACAKLREKQRERLGVDKLRFYDEALIFPEGNAAPIGDMKYMIEEARKMYHELSEETGEFFDFMADYELFDLETRPGKHQGGYCTYLLQYKAPFIFSNFNGTSADVEVLTHEAGHAFAGYTAARCQPLPEFTNTTSEVAEIHSMTMEHFTYPWMERFFGDKADKFKYAHLSQALLIIPYMMCVDEFQHRVFENPSMSPMDRRKVWKSLEEVYMPWRDYDGNEFLTGGGFWMQKQHIFMYPFYYIDYALAQTCAFQLYARRKHDKKQAWKDYMALCQVGGSKGYLDILALGHLKSPFEEGTVKNAVEEVFKELGI